MTDSKGTRACMQPSGLTCRNWQIDLYTKQNKRIKFDEKETYWNFGFKKIVLWWKDCKYWWHEKNFLTPLSLKAFWKNTVWFVERNISTEKLIDVEATRKRLPLRLKKKYFVSKLARIFQSDAACGFLFLFYFIFYFNWPLPPRTSKTKNDWKVSTSVFSEIKRDFTRFLSSHVLKFFQSSKFSLFFVVKMKKK